MNSAVNNYNHWPKCRYCGRPAIRGRSWNIGRGDLSSLCGHCFSVRSRLWDNGVFGEWHELAMLIAVTEEQDG